jgi:hypothetical protein
MRDIENCHADIKSARRFDKKIPGFADRVPLHTVQITFHGKALPDTIKLGITNRKVHPYIPRPTRCSHCQKFGHPQGACKIKDIAPATCPKCSGPHKISECQSEAAKCPNCKGSHTATDPKCPAHQKAKRAQKISTTQHITYAQAIKKAAHPQQGPKPSQIRPKKPVAKHIPSLLTIETRPPPPKTQTTNQTRQVTQGETTKKLKVTIQNSTPLSPNTASPTKPKITKAKKGNKTKKPTSAAQQVSPNPEPSTSTNQAIPQTTPPNPPISKPTVTQANNITITTIEDGKIQVQVDSKLAQILFLIMHAVSKPAFAKADQSQKIRIATSLINKVYDTKINVDNVEQNLKAACARESQNPTRTNNVTTNQSVMEVTNL